MEAANRTRNRTRRTPLSDRTNFPSSIKPTTKPTKPNPLPLSSSSSSTSSSLFHKPPIKRASATTNLDAASNPSSPPPPIPSTPALNSSSLTGTVVVADHEASEPISITYSRSNKRKDKGKTVAVTEGRAPDLNVSSSRKDEGKALAVTESRAPDLNVSSSWKDKGKAVAVTESRAPDLNVSSSRKDKGKAVADAVSHTPDLMVSYNRKDKGKALAIPVSRTPDLKVYNNREGVNLSKAKAWSVPCRKKQRTVPSAEDMFKDPLLQEFIEKQKAYFKAVDEFELPEEEVESVDQLD